VLDQAISERLVYHRREMMDSELSTNSEEALPYAIDVTRSSSSDRGYNSKTLPYTTDSCSTRMGRQLSGSQSRAVVSSAIILARTKVGSLDLDESVDSVTVRFVGSLVNLIYWCVIAFERGVEFIL